MQMQETIIKLHKLNKDLIIDMAEKDQLVTELSQELEAHRKIINKWRLQDEAK